MNRRAYCTFDTKGIDDDKRVIRGLASTPTADKVGDVMEPMGAEYTLPIPLLWQHDMRQPIGHVTAARATPKGIEVEARILRIDEPGKLRDRLDEAWHSVKHGLVRGLSIGFRGKEATPIRGGGMHFLKWVWHELSTVTLPMNGEATILAVKSADESVLRDLGLLKPHLSYAAWREQQGWLREIKHYESGLSPEQQAMTVTGRLLEVALRAEHAGVQRQLSNVNRYIKALEARLAEVEQR